MHRRRSLVARTALLRIDLLRLEGRDVGVVFLEEVVPVECPLGEADEFVGWIEHALVVDHDDLLIGTDSETVRGAVTAGVIRNVDRVGRFLASDWSE